MADGDESDGRKLRRARNRQNVIIALLDLVRSGELNPSVADIAERAGVSHRSVFRYFDDLGDLVRAAIDFEIARCIHLADIPDTGVGPLNRRIESWVESRIRLLSATYQLGRVARYRAVDIPSVEDGLKWVYYLSRTRMYAHFAQEIEALGTEGDLMLDAGMILTGFESYDFQSRVMEHGEDRIRQMWALTLHELFARTPVN